MQCAYLQVILVVGLGSDLLLKRAAQPGVEKLQRYQPQQYYQHEPTQQPAAPVTVGRSRRFRCGPGSGRIGGGNRFGHGNGAMDGLTRNAPARVVVASGKSIKTGDLLTKWRNPE